MIVKEALKVVEEYTYPGQRVSANPAHEKEIRRKIRKGYSVFDKHNLMNGSLTLSEKTGE